MRNYPLRPLSTGAAALLLAGCSMIPQYERPAAPVADAWPSAAAAVAQPGAQVLAADLPWQDFVQDARLRSVIAMALAHNRDLRMAWLNIEQARAQYQIRRADSTPTVNLAASAARQPASDGSGGISSTYSVGLALASWEIDFFGRIASLQEAALAQYLATQEARNAVQTSLVAAVASSWLNLQTNDALLLLTQRTLATREDSLRLTRLRFDQGVSSALDLRQAQSLAASARATLAQQQRLRSLDINALTLLAGAPLPEALLPTGDAAAPALASVPAGLPSDLLSRRPDVLQAEQQLRAANANIGAARAAFFPRIALTASAGTASSSLSGLFKGGAWGWTLAPQALLPIFDAGRNQAGLESATVGRELAIAQYEKSIQLAFREAADALAGRATLDRQLQATQEQADAEADRFRLADLRYRNGIANYLDVLDAQRALFATQQAVAQIRLARQQNEVALYKALGGGWRAPAQAELVGALAGS
ncbi:efflux transporter outer membrane subunit [Simplicispira suum]|uniref:Multidrug transporter n=1 Tax=Simplicispira suum TaxID=2109915 RepID=A0A2S0N1C6_9BURK|nr:efflux transporter outer membrane subunit [Simplicispira suum]AVO41949.1 multidrug transporter [Simplicispira suum]